MSTRLPSSHVYLPMHFQEKTRLEKEAQASRDQEIAAKATAAREVCGGIVKLAKN